MSTDPIKGKQGPAKSTEEQQALVLPSHTLFQNHNELVIEHAGQHYHLRITRQNKLILTK